MKKKKGKWVLVLSVPPGDIIENRYYYIRAPKNIRYHSMICGRQLRELYQDWQYWTTPVRVPG